MAYQPLAIGPGVGPASLAIGIAPQPFVAGPTAAKVDGYVPPALLSNPPSLSISATPASGAPAAAPSQLPVLYLPLQNLNILKNYYSPMDASTKGN